MKKLLPFLFIILLFSSCEDDIDLTAPYKDITIVYGLLNGNDSKFNAPGLSYVQKVSTYTNLENGLGILVQEPREDILIFLYIKTPWIRLFMERELST